jgi:hypothetical protein
MSDWSKDAAKRFREKQRAEQERLDKEKEARETQERKQLLDAHTLELNAPTLWTELCTSFETSCNEFSSDIGNTATLKLRQPDPNTLEISSQITHLKLTAIFDPQRYTIAFHGLTVGDIKRLDIKVKPGSSDLALFQNGTLVNPDRVVQKTLEELLGLGS